jgi:3-hydroxyisobutyrate dehydrogenase
MSDSIAVIGLGAMGGRVAARLAGSGHTVYGYDPAPIAGEAAADSGVVVKSTADEAVRESTLIILSLPRPEHVLAAAHGPLSHAPAGSLVVDLSTIDPATARAAATALAEREVGYVDAPVLGRPERCGHWTLAIGGPADALARIRPILEGPVAARLAHIGDVGAGCVVKLLNNLMFGVINAITAEALATCRAAGVDPQVFVETVADSGAATVSNLFRELAPKIIAEDYQATFALSLLHKDNRLALQLMHDTGTPTLLAGSVDLVNSLGLKAGLGEQDTGAVYRLYGSNGSA